MTDTARNGGGEVVTLYFAYGSNMDPAQMRQRCPGAEPRGRAVLADHEFRINRSGVATVVPASGDVVHGVLWSLTAEHVDTLDGYEGVARSEYEKLRTVVDAGASVDVLIYIATEDRSGIPRPGYLERILAGAAHFDLPSEYLARIGRWRREEQATGGTQ